MRDSASLAAQPEDALLVAGGERVELVVRVVERAPGCAEHRDPAADDTAGRRSRARRPRRSAAYRKGARAS